MLMTSDGMFDNVLNLHNQILSRKCVVQDQLAQFAHTNDWASDVPRCLLETELGVLNKLVNVLDRELWHMKESTPALDCTYEGMISSDWKERLKAEWAQLCIRMERLDTFRDALREDKIDFTPRWDERLLCDQLRAMRNYRDCLLSYAKIEGVELDMTLYDDSYMYDYYFKNLSDQEDPN